MEDKKKIIKHLEMLLKITRAGSDIADLVFDEREETVTVSFATGYARKVSVVADSGISIIKDVIKVLE